MHCMNCGQKITSENIEVCVVCGKRTGHITPKTMRQKVVSQEKAIQQEKERIQHEIVERLTDTNGDWEKKMEYIYEPMDALDGIISDYTNKMINEYTEYTPVNRVDESLLESLTKGSNNEVFSQDGKVQIENLINKKEILNQTPTLNINNNQNTNVINNNDDDDDIPSTIITKNEEFTPPPKRKNINNTPNLYVVSGVEDEQSVSKELEEVKSAKEVIQEKVDEIQAEKKALAIEQEKASKHIENDVKEYITNNQTKSPPQAQHPQAQNQYPQTQGQHQQAQAQHPQAQAQHPQPQTQHPQAQAQHPQPQTQHPQAQTQHPQTQNQYPQPQGQNPQTQNQHPQTQVKYPQAQAQYPQTQGQYPQTQGQYPQAQVQHQQAQYQPQQTPMQTTIPSQYYNNQPSNGMVQPIHPSQIPQPRTQQNANDFSRQNPQIIDETNNVLNEKRDSPVKMFMLSFVSFTALFAVCIGIFMLIPRDFKIENGTLIEYTGRDTVVQIPSKVAKIGDGVFENLSFIEEIIIPETVTSIGNSAFANCTSLTNVQFHENITYFGDNVLDGVPLFAGYIFDGSRLVEYNGGETNVVIPDFVTVIGKQAFFNNDTMETLALPSGLRTIEEVAFSSCDTIQSISIPVGTTTIENSAFSGCDNLSNINIPSSVNFIGSDAFSGTPWYNNLSEEFNIYGDNVLIKYVGRNADVTIPDNVTFIGNAAFRNNENIKTVTIPSRVKEIGYQAFSGCTYLETVVINEGVTTISEGAFLGCFALRNMEFPSTIKSVKYMSLRSTTWYQNFYDKFGIIGGSTLVRYFGDESWIEIPVEVKHITDEAFAGTPFVEVIIMPSSIIYIDDRAFDELPNLEKIYCIQGSYVDKYFTGNDELAHIEVAYG